MVRLAYIRKTTLQQTAIMDEYLDYDDFSANSRGGGGGGGGKIGGGNRKRGGKSGSSSNDSGSGTIYNSKHIRIGQAKREKTAQKESGSDGKSKKNKR